MIDSVCDVLVIGSGPGGYVAAIKAAQLGFKVIIVEKDRLGGVCLNWGCIPTKTLLRSAQILTDIKNAATYGIEVSDYKINFAKIIQRSRSVASEMGNGVSCLLQKNKIEVTIGEACFLPDKTIRVICADGSKKNYKSKHIIIATGARNRQIFDTKSNEFVLGYKDVFALKTQPKKIVIIGGGAIGIEFACFFNAIGSQVIMLEKSSAILSVFDPDITLCLHKEFSKKGIEIYTGVSINNLNKIHDNEYSITYTDSMGVGFSTQCDVILSAVGIRANIENLGLEALNIEIKNDKIVVDDFFRTSVDGIYAIGDVINTISLAHVASAEACVCVEAIAGLEPEKIDYHNIPSCIYASPEIASVGYTETQALEKNHSILVGKFPFKASGKACAVGNSEGFVKVIFDKKYGEWLGAHIVGHNATELIAEVVVAKNLETTGYEIMRSVHPHPTMSEALFEAVCNAYGECVNI